MQISQLIVKSDSSSQSQSQQNFVMNFIKENNQSSHIWDRLNLSKLFPAKQQFTRKQSSRQFIYLCEKKQHQCTYIKKFIRPKQSSSLTPTTIDHQYLEGSWLRRQKIRRKVNHEQEWMVQKTPGDNISNIPFSKRDKKAKISNVQCIAHTIALREKNKSLINMPDTLTHQPTNKSQRKCQSLTPYLKKRLKKKTQKTVVLNFQTQPLRNPKPYHKITQVKPLHLMQRQKNSEAEQLIKRAGTTSIRSRKQQIDKCHLVNNIQAFGQGISFRVKELRPWSSSKKLGEQEYF